MMITIVYHYLVIRYFKLKKEKIKKLKVNTFPQYLFIACTKPKIWEYFFCVVYNVISMSGQVMK